MQLDLTDAVESPADPALLWPRLLNPSAVIGFLSSGGDGAADIRPFVSPDASPAQGHTFRITGAGGGLYHARIDRRDEHSMISYAVWRADVPESMMLLTFTIDAAGPRTMLTGVVTMDMPLAELLTSFSPAGALAVPLVGPLVRRYAAHRLHTHLLALAAPPA